MVNMPAQASKKTAKANGPSNTAPVIWPLVMELGVTPALWLWQGRVSKFTPSSLRWPEGRETE